MIAQILEAAMLVAFGLSWPLNAYKAYQARTAAGTSWQFILLITLGYVAGIAAKIAGNTINWVLIVYFINVIAIAVNWAIYFRNVKLDNARVEAAALKAVDTDHHLGRVIIATDGSKAALKAARFAADRLHLDEGAEVTVMGVAPVDTPEAKAAANGHLDETVKFLEHIGAHVKTVVRCGSPATRIVEEASLEGADIVVMGSRGLSGLRALALGSVSRDVVNKVACPVLTVK